MNTTNQSNNIAALSVTIAPRNPARGVLNFVVTLTTHKDVRSYPCRSMESAIKLAERFIAGGINPRRAAAALCRLGRRPFGVFTRRCPRSILGVPRPQHRHEARRLLLPPPLGARLLKPPVRAGSL